MRTSGPAISRIPLEEARIAARARDHLVDAADEEHMAVARAGEPAARKPPALGIVAEEFRHPCLGDVLVHHHAGTAAVDLLGQCPRARMVGDEDQPVGMALPDMIEIFEFAVGAVQRGMQRERQAPRIGLGLDRRHEGGEEGRGNVGHHERDRIRPSEAQPPGMGIGAVVQGCGWPCRWPRPCAQAARASRSDSAKRSSSTRSPPAPHPEDWPFYLVQMIPIPK